MPAVPLTRSSYTNYYYFIRTVGALSSWMREHGYYLAGHTRKERLSVQTVEDCWEACLQETEFECLSVAYAAVGEQSCRLYDNKALSVYRDWTYSDKFSYYEYCANGGWHNLTNIYLSVKSKTQQNISHTTVSGEVSACRFYSQIKVNVTLNFL